MMASDGSGGGRRQGFTEIGGSACTLPGGATCEGPLPADHPVAVSIYLKPKSTDPAGSGDPFERRASLHRADIDALCAHASDHGLTVLEADPARRLVRLSGTAAQISEAFDTRLEAWSHDGHRFHANSRPLGVPDALHGVVESVLGLDTRAIAHSRIVRPRRSQPAGIEPNKLAQLYDFPSGATGSGVTVALIELGGGFRASDNNAAFKAMGLRPPTVLAVSVDGATNTPGGDADGEVALDIQVVGGVAPGARIAVYFAPNTDAGFADAISQAVHDRTNKPSVISISWGSAESSWSNQSVTTMNSVLADAAAAGVSVFAASGDSLATDGVDDGAAHVDFPASSPSAIGCGGTFLSLSGGAIARETVWNDDTGNGGGQDGGGTGGGISDLFPVPPFQQNANLPPSVNGGRKGRGVPDVAGNAAPGSGYAVVVDGQKQVVGGTSAVAPLWAGLTALINGRAAKPVGFLPDFLYAQPASAGLTVPITQGNNKPEGSSIGYDAGPGWNACTGLGRPNGQKLFDALTGSTGAIS
ncbi:S53 family peptidase [Rhizosaccharibacter radicis]|uniref:S53 family peptidase n=1 Tax=Rhizosaccharibacter radicis TaxID=2782605 RepID=A0ABT1W1R0_9PROT|nr:S53 family peptidase [Acetobacteraceae bacterium KSS12]